MSTPDIPRKFREFHAEGWVNVFELLPDCQRLYGTESLFGNWNGRVLLLAKDGAPACAIKKLNIEGASWQDVWRHASRERGDQKGVRTNERLEIFAKRFEGDALYGSAAAHMLRDDDTWSRALPDMHSGPLHEHLKDVLSWVVGHMPNLQLIVCLGGDAWRLCYSTFGIQERLSYKEARDSGILASFERDGEEIRVAAMFHPGARVSIERMRSAWASLYILSPG